MQYGASSQVQSLGGTKRRRQGVGPPHREHTFPTREASGEGQIFLFCDLKMAYFGEFGGAKFKVFFLYRELPQWGSGRFRGKLWIFEQSNE